MKVNPSWRVKKKLSGPHGRRTSFPDEYTSAVGVLYQK